MGSETGTNCPEGPRPSYGVVLQSTGLNSYLGTPSEEFKQQQPYTGIEEPKVTCAIRNHCVIRA